MICAKNREQIAEELSTISCLSRSKLIERWIAVHNRPPPKGISRRLLEYSAAYQLQAKAFGGLKPTVRRKLRHITTRKKTTNYPVLHQTTKTLQSGTRLVREWHGQIYSVILAGRQPVELTPEKLKRLRNLPKSWEEQRQLLGFTG